MQSRSASVVLLMLFFCASYGADRAVAQSVRARVAAVGDLMCHDDQIKHALYGNGYSYDSCFMYVAPLLKKADLATGNLETVHAGADAVFAGYPSFNTPDEYSAALKRAGFDVITTANNHAYDRQMKGITRTLDVLEKLGFAVTGTSRSDTVRSKPVLLTANGIRLAFLAYTYGVNKNALPNEHRQTVNITDTTWIKEDLAYLHALPKENRPDKILLALHWGVENSQARTTEQQAFAKRLFELGIDVILGSHPHKIQPAEHHTVLRNGESVECFVIYSMGNFLSNMLKRYQDTGVIVWVDFEKDHATGKTTLKDTRYTLTYCYRFMEHDRIKHRLLPIEQTLQTNTAPPAVKKIMEEMRKELGDLLGSDKRFLPLAAP